MDITVLPLYTSHLLQPLDISISSPLIRAFSTEIEKLFRLDTRRISRIAWNETFLTARAHAFISRDIESPSRASGIYPLSLILSSRLSECLLRPLLLLRFVLRHRMTEAVPY
jgi:hypothetical protein